MNRPSAIAVFVLSLAAISGWGVVQSAASPAGGRSVAFTFDDLPASRLTTLAEGRSITTALVNHLKALRIPAVGFVNETKLDDVPGEERARAALLEAWLEAGFELGNHTYSHVRLSDVPLATYEADVLHGERVTRPLMTAHGRKLRYFRHPTLNTGPDLKTKASFERFLSRHGYRVAPVTIDSDEYLYALAYDRARSEADTSLMRRLGEDYVRYMERMFDFYEGLSQRLLGREPPQVLMLHANALNAHYVDELAAALLGRGYRFVTLEAALRDAAYRLRDQYIGKRGPSWLERWAITQGLDPGRPPEIPVWVHEATR